MPSEARVIESSISSPRIGARAVAGIAVVLAWSVLKSTSIWQARDVLTGA
jgi:hypothetical protein